MQQQASSNANVLASPPWFAGAPLTKLTVYGMGLTYLLVESRGLHSKLAVDTNAILNYGQWYRFLTGTLAFRTSGEIIIGLGLIANFQRRLEREMDSRKFAVFLAATFFLSTLFSLIVAHVLDIPLQYSGPYPTMGALVWYYHRYVPRLHPRFFSLLGLQVSEKSMGYAFFAQCILYRGLGTLIPSTLGMAAAALVFFFQTKWHVPSVVASMILFLTNLVDTPAPMVVQQHQHRMGTAPRTAAAAVLPRTPVAQQPLVAAPPPEAAIEQLTSMGFAREDVLRALQATNNSVERAADRLLTGN